MKRAKNLYPQIADYDNLACAFLKAVKGKRTRPDVIEFTRHFDANMGKLMNGLLNGKPDIGHYRFFQVRDPKARQICAAAFPERVLHHAIMNVCEPVLEKYAIFDSYACRKGKGPQAAVKRAQYFSGKFEWYLKLDIRKYFDSIDHTIMIRLLFRRIKDDDVLRLFWDIFQTYETLPGKGMPIGNLISQHLANFYLGRFDHRIKEERKVRGYLRYMDDFILFGKNKSDLKTEIPLIRDFLTKELELELKPIQLNRSVRGIPFLGYRVFPNRILLSPAGKRRFVRKFIAFERKWVKGEWSDDTLVRHMEPLFAYAKFADSSNFRKNVLERYGVPY